MDHSKGYYFLKRQSSSLKRNIDIQISRIVCEKAISTFSDVMPGEPEIISNKPEVLRVILKSAMPA